ncbi:MAG: hypothetical protein PVI40_05820 [Chlamydiota bacterium]|jgi:chaperonin GroEL (HSP60 family)
MANQPEKIIFYQKARSKLLAGISKLLQQINEVPDLLEKPFLEKLSLSDPHENIGLKLGVAFLIKTQGSHQVRLFFLEILYKLIQSGISWINKEKDPFFFYQALKKSKTYLTQNLQKNSKTLHTFEELLAMARTITQDDQVLACIKQYLKNDDPTNELQIHTYFADPLHKSYFKEIELENVQVAIYNKEVESIFELLPLLETYANNFETLVIVAKKFAPNLIATFAINRMENIQKIYPLMAADPPSLQKLQIFADQKTLISVDKVILSEKSTSFLQIKDNSIPNTLDPHQEDMYKECLYQLKEAKKSPIAKDFYSPLVSELQASINTKLEITQQTLQYIPMAIFENNLATTLATVELLIQTDAAIAAGDMEG